MYLQKDRIWTNYKYKSYLSVGTQFGSSLTDSAVEVARISARLNGSPSYIHSFGMSKNYIVFIEQPLFLDDDHAKSGCASNPSSDKISGEKPHRQNYTWKRGDMVSLNVNIHIRL